MFNIFDIPVLLYEIMIFLQFKSRTSKNDLLFLFICYTSFQLKSLKIPNEQRKTDFYGFFFILSFKFPVLIKK